MLKKITLFFILFTFVGLLAQSKPTITFEELFISSEINPQITVEAIALAKQSNLPINLLLKDEALINATGIENGKVVYTVINNFMNPYDGGETCFFDELVAKYDLSKAEVNYGTGISPKGTSELWRSNEPFLMMVVSGTNSVAALNKNTGDVLEMNFIPGDGAHLATPKQAQLSPRGTVTISEQVNDGVYEYDTSGTFSRMFAPAGGINNAILDNVRGHHYKPDGTLMVANGDGGNTDCIVQFDNDGVFTSNFNTPNSTLLDSPYDILLRDSDVLVSAYTTKAIVKFGTDGTYIGKFAEGINFPQQIVETPDGKVVVADFGVGGGVRVYSPDGLLLHLFNVITANRGVYLLDNGNYLTSNAGGLFELDSANGTLLRTIIQGSQCQFISTFDLAYIPVELTSFSASIINESVVLNWETATELNNIGFEVEKSLDGKSFQKIGFVNGNGTTTNKSYYHFVDQSNIAGIYYRLKQIDYDGSINYSKVVEVNDVLPNEFILFNNYPNPFNPTTTIKFGLPVESFVELKVFNVLGQEVATLINSKLGAGLSEVNFDASNLTSGIYIYKLKATGINGQSFTKSIKMNLIK